MQFGNDDYYENSTI